MFILFEEINFVVSNEHHANDSTGGHRKRNQKTRRSNFNAIRNEVEIGFLLTEGN
jgi:hypothetical protein